MSKETDLLQPLSITFEGVTLPFVCNGEVELAYTLWLEMHCREKISRRKEALGSEYYMHMKIWQEKVDSEEYEWTGYTSLMSRNSEAGKKQLLWLMMAKAGADANPHTVDKIMKSPEKVLELFNDDVGDGKPPLGLYWKAIAQGRPT